MKPFLMKDEPDHRIHVKGLLSVASIILWKMTRNIWPFFPLVLTFCQNSVRFIRRYNNKSPSMSRTFFYQNIFYLAFSLNDGGRSASKIGGVSPEKT
jgi:hypothetical protein